MVDRVTDDVADEEERHPPEARIEAQLRRRWYHLMRRKPARRCAAQSTSWSCASMEVLDEQAFARSLAT
jgi:hypothetical protein